MSDEIRSLLTFEIKKRLPALEASPEDAKSALMCAVSLRGSASLANEPNLAAALSRLEPRLRAGDQQAVLAVISLLQHAAARLEQGKTALGGSWPIPPANLERREVEPSARAPYETEMRTRLAGLDRCLNDASLEPVAAVQEAFRHVHTLKGAASAVGDEPMSWFCQGLEQRLHGIDDPATARAALDVLAKYRETLAGLSDGALRRLHGTHSLSPSLGVLVEPMVEKDIEAVLDIAAENTSRSEQRPASVVRQANATRLREELARPWARLRVARAPSGEVLAYIVAWHVADEVHVIDVATKLLARRHGLSRALLDDLLAFAKDARGANATQTDAPVKHVLLEVRRSNSAAIHLYRSKGFFATNVRKRYYDDGEDAIEMRLVLDDVTREVRSMVDEVPLDIP